ncbi:molybdopterin-guanine dinucleotide biosynthesis protein B [Marininema halotolerans]|uniref:Molybdopterin-guanine dinucleotide biosynthesis protein B n=1 Tax=Marininema halotolerans TaxID=1155944 RepID=A0A1I6R284_9BACL|nr:molybdopterin-guanine dinucleotide biosynthesis protein B [Marininema halotolerans]SFS58792.1 molybdopterin-guanine dinucleotide biosynthesis protein B [Marininema halotolerans]
MQPLVLQLVGHSGSGKTTLITQLVENLTAKGYRVGTIKHHHRELEMDTVGKDSWSHRKAGATLVSLVGQNQTAIYYPFTYSLTEVLVHYQSMDLVLVEGYKQESFAKWAILKPGENIDWVKALTQIQAIVASEPMPKVPWPVYYAQELSPMVQTLTNQLAIRTGRDEGTESQW